MYIFRAALIRDTPYLSSFSNPNIWDLSIVSFFLPGYYPAFRTSMSKF